MLPLDLADKLIQYESGELSLRETVQLFSVLISTGVVWQLQGFYGRAARRFIESHLLDNEGKINWDNVNHHLIREDV